MPTGWGHTRTGPPHLSHAQKTLVPARVPILLQDKEEPPSLNDPQTVTFLEPGTYLERQSAWRFAQ